jgi:BON domain
MVGDLELRQDVFDELEFEPSVNAAHIGVTANKGVVTLTGFVTSYAEKAAAERAARRVKGVKAIAEEIEVRLPSHTKRADDEIAARAVDILKWQVGFPADRINVKLEKGIVTLTGEVDWQFQKMMPNTPCTNLPVSFMLPTRFGFPLRSTPPRLKGRSRKRCSEAPTSKHRGLRSKQRVAGWSLAARSVPGTSEISPNGPHGPRRVSPRFRTV